jgi:hypothetical protein
VARQAIGILQHTVKWYTAWVEKIRHMATDALAAHARIDVGSMALPAIKNSMDSLQGESRGCVAETGRHPTLNPVALLAIPKSTGMDIILLVTRDALRSAAGQIRTLPVTFGAFKTAVHSEKRKWRDIMIAVHNARAKILG